MEEHNVTYVKDGETLTGMQAKLQRIVDSNDGKAIIDEFKDIIRRSYGRKDGDRFLKSKLIWEDFASSEAFSQLLFELCTDPGAAAEFINGVVPNNLDQIADEIRARAAETTATVQETVTPEANGDAPKVETSDKPTSRVLTNAEIVEMDADELKSGLATGRYKLS